MAQRVVSSTFKIVQILDNLYFELVSSCLALEGTEPVSGTVTEMAVELINIHLISVQQKRLHYYSYKNHNIFFLK
jgi:hypothetical protein